MQKSLIKDTNKLINSELGIFPFKYFKCNKDIINALDELKKQYKNHTEMIDYYKKKNGCNILKIKCYAINIYLKK